MRHVNARGRVPAVVESNLSSDILLRNPGRDRLPLRWLTILAAQSQRECANQLLKLCPRLLRGDATRRSFGSERRQGRRTKHISYSSKPL